MRAVSRRLLHFVIALAIIALSSALPTHAQGRGAVADRPMINRATDPLLQSFRFRSIGPASMGGRIDDIEVAPSDPNVIYVGYAVGGVFKSENNGTTFEPIFETYPTASVGDIAVDPRNADIVYVGTGEANNRQTSSFGDGIYKSTDGGKTFQHIGLRETQTIARIVIDPRNTNVLYVAATGALFNASPDRGVYKSTDAGRTWTKVKFVDENTGFTDIAIDQSNPNVLYAASYQRRRSGCCFNGGGPGSALWKTDDGGRTWTKLTNGLPTATLGRIAVDVSRSNPNVVYAQVEAGQSGTPLVAAAAPAAAPAEPAPETPIGGGGGGRGGFNWCNNGGPGGGFGGGGGGGGGRAAAAGAAPQTPPALNGNASGVYRSDNGGRTWRVVSNCNARPMYFSQIRVDPQNPNTVYVAGLPVAKSLDGGKTFATLDNAGGHNSPGHVDQHAIWVDPRNSKHLIIGNDGGLDISWDQGRTWDYVNTMATALAYWVSADMRHPYHVQFGLQDNGSWGGPSSKRSGDGILNSDFYGIGGGDGFQTAADPRDFNIVFTESQDGNTNRYNFRTGEVRSVRPTAGGGGGRAGAQAAGGTPPACVDGRSGGRGFGGGGGGGRGGGGRGNVLNAQPGDAYRFNWNTPFILSPHNPDILWLGGNRLFKSYNQGETYVASPDLTRRIDRCNVEMMGVPGNQTQLSKNDGVSAYSTIIAISESRVMPGVVWAGTDDGQVQVSRDGGATFTEVGKNIRGLPAGALTGNHAYWIARIDASHFDAGTAYIAVDGHRSGDLRPYAFVTKDYGATWTNITNNLPAYGNLQVIREDPKNRNLLYVGTEFGLYVSLDGGARWQKFMNNYPTVRTDDILVHPRDGDLIVATHGRSIWIADDITPLQQLTSEVMAQDAYLFDVRPAIAYLVDRQLNVQTGGQKFFEGENAPRGTAINYYLKAAANDVRVQIADYAGRVLCRGDAPTTAGVNRVQWGLTAPLLAQAAGAGGFGGGGGGGGRGGAQATPPNPSCSAGGGGGGRGGFGGGGGGGVQPGTYTVTLTVDGKTFTKPVRVLADEWFLTER